MDRRKIERQDGSVTIVVSGPAGAVSLDAWTYEGRVKSVLGIHLAYSEAIEIPSACEHLPTGLCYPDQTFRHGQEAAEALMAYRDDEAWAVVEEWYRNRIEGIGAQ